MEIPKAELHIHLEGAICPNDLSQLTEKYESGSYTVDDIYNRFKFTSFSSFLDTWSWKNKFLREYEDFEYISHMFAQSRVKQNIIYTELFISPSDFLKNDLSISRIVESIYSGLSKEPSAEISLICDLVRDNGPEGAERVLDEVSDLKEFNVIGVGLGGSEHKFPASLFRNVFNKAREIDFNITAHAGEACGPESIWQAIDLGITRVGHGIRAWDDKKLVEHLAEEGIALELCPTSNLLTKATGYNENSYPIKELMDSGVTCTINTDDPDMFNIDLATELFNCNSIWGIEYADIIKLIRNGFELSWAPQKQKQILNRYLDSFLKNELIYK